MMQFHVTLLARREMTHIIGNHIGPSEIYQFFGQSSPHVILDSCMTGNFETKAAERCKSNVT